MQQIGMSQSVCGPFRSFVSPVLKDVSLVASPCYSQQLARLTSSQRLTDEDPPFTSQLLTNEAPITIIYRSIRDCPCLKYRSLYARLKVVNTAMGAVDYRMQ